MYILFSSHAYVFYELFFKAFAVYARTHLISQQLRYIQMHTCSVNKSTSSVVRETQIQLQWVSLDAFKYYLSSLGLF